MRERWTSWPQAADDLLAKRPPGEALEAWLDLLIDYMATKRVVAPPCAPIPGEGSRVYASRARPSCRPCSA
jgi:hypothetical protein